MINSAYYRPLQDGWWTGRVDGTTDPELRWHQSIRMISLNELPEPPDDKNMAFLGFVSDEGVRRNKGRIGAAKAPEQIRRSCASLPTIEGIRLYDAGDITCNDGNLERAQEQLAIAVAGLLEKGFKPILLGGGHEILFGHYSGIKRAFPKEKIGVINLDAHFDLRKPEKEGVSSGTGFWQIAKDTEADEFNYLAIGIQKAANTRALFEEADRLGVSYIYDTDVNPMQITSIRETLSTFFRKIDHVYLTVDMDVFSSAYAPGVSAANAKGLAPDYIFDEVLSSIMESGKVVSVDFAEVNPDYDRDGQTAKLAARLIFDLLNVWPR